MELKMSHKNFPYNVSQNYNKIYNFLNSHSEFFLIGFTENSPNHMFKMRKSIHTGDVIIVDSHIYTSYANTVEEFEKICKDLKLCIIEPTEEINRNEY
jgi:hypothetical protein